MKSRNVFNLVAMVQKFFAKLTRENKAVLKIILVAYTVFGVCLLLFDLPTVVIVNWATSYFLAHCVYGIWRSEKYLMCCISGVVLSIGLFMFANWTAWGLVVFLIGGAGFILFEPQSSFIQLLKKGKS